MKPTNNDKPSVNALAAPLVEALIRDAGGLSLAVEQSSIGCRIVDAGLECKGSIEAGRRIAEICMADLGRVTIAPPEEHERSLSLVHVETAHPVLSCLGSQYAGWSLKYDSEVKFRALGSGPARSLAVKEPLFAELGYQDRSDQTCMVIETSQKPPEGLLKIVANECGVTPDRLTVILTPTGSLAGLTQIVARVVEVALHKAHEIAFELDSIVSACGNAPLPPPTSDDMVAMGRTNDTILFAGHVSMVVDCGDDAARQLANDLPSCNSRDYGKPFAQIFKDYDYNFFDIDPLLFSPARVSITEKTSNRTFVGGSLDYGLLHQSFFG